MKVSMEDRAILRDLIAYSMALLEVKCETDAYEIERLLILVGEKTKALSDDFMCDFFTLWWEGHCTYNCLLAMYLDAFDSVDWIRRNCPILEMFITHLRNVVG